MAAYRARRKSLGDVAQHYVIRRKKADHHSCQESTTDTADLSGSRGAASIRRHAAIRASDALRVATQQQEKRMVRHDTVRIDIDGVWYV